MVQVVKHIRGMDGMHERLNEMWVEQARILTAKLLPQDRHAARIVCSVLPVVLAAIRHDATLLQAYLTEHVALFF